MIKNGRAIGNDTKDKAFAISQKRHTLSLFFNSTTNCEVVIFLLLELYVRLNIKHLLPLVTEIIYTKLMRKAVLISIIFSNRLYYISLYLKLPQREHFLHTDSFFLPIFP